MQGCSGRILARISSMQNVRENARARLGVALLFSFVAAVAVQSQQEAKPAGATSASQASPGPNTRDASAPNPGMFYDPDLDLHFNFPVEMNTLDAAAEMETGHLNIYGVSGANDPEHLEAKRCMHFLLDADLPQDKAPQRTANMDGVWVDDTEQYKESRKPAPIFAKILVVEMVRSCLPKKLQKNENDALGNIALSFVSEPGLLPMAKPLWFEVGGENIHMNSAAGRPVVNGQLAAAPILVMSMATEWHGRLLAWVFTSNDTEIFNEITKSLVRFGDGPWGPMFAANIGPKGSGTPLTILPK
jgi:hypothetical protein